MIFIVNNLNYMVQNSNNNVKEIHPINRFHINLNAHIIIGGQLNDII